MNSIRASIRRFATQAGLLALVVAGAIVPLVVRAHFAPVPPAIQAHWTGEATHVDFYAYQKMVLLLACGVVCLLAIVAAPHWKRRAAVYYIGVGLFLAGVGLSTALSSYRGLAFWGCPGRYEGALVLASYMALLLAAVQFAQSARQIHVLLVCVAGSSLLIAIIGAAQLAGHDPMLSSVGRWLILPDSPPARQGGMAANSLPFMITSTLYNPNYVGSYMAMLGPLFLGLYCFADRRLIRGALLGLTALLYLNLMGSHSRAGMLAGTVATLVVISAVWRLARERLRRLGPLAAALVLAGVVVNLVSQGGVTRQLAHLASDIKGLMVPSDVQLAVKRIDIKGASIRFETTQETLVIEHVDGRLQFGDGSQLLRVFTQKAAGVLIFHDPRFRAYRVTVNPQNLLVVQRLGLPAFQFGWLGKGFGLLDARGRAVASETAQEWLHAGRESVGSGRLYIWARALPLMRGSFIRGAGPDTFAMRFPQDDLVLKANVYGRLDVLVDKPHCLYLQMAINTGGVSLLAIMIIFAHYTWTSLRLYLWQPSRASLAPTGACLFAGFCGYAVAAIFNDSVVSVAPVFWTLLGLGIAVNLRVAGEFPATEPTHQG